MNNIHIKRDQNFIDNLMHTLNNEGAFTTWKLFKMAYEAEKSMLSKSFHDLIALNYLPEIEFLQHQIETAQKVIQQMHGRAILADEVGLGKTIEAGLILKEYMIRGLVKKVLILVPASLVNQWQRELQEKFYISAVTYRKNFSWNDVDIMISSLDTAKREPHKSEILNLQYDLVLVDEAHKLKNNKTLNYQFVQSIQKKYCLLLTATPIQNNLTEIFNLVAILKPGLLGSYDSFIKRFGNDRNLLHEDAYLKQLIQKVMIRNRRSEIVFDDTKRHIETIWINFSEDEQMVYENITQLTAFIQTMLRRELCSSREACYLSLKKLANQEQSNELKKLIKQIEQLPHHVKAKKVVEIIHDIHPHKTIIFTEYRATQFYLQWYLQQNGISSVLYNGKFNKSKKDWMMQLFKQHAQVLIATEAGAEGINLQFCRYLINYDLPWNPMKLEQRIGRIHRFGQTNDVHIYNLAIRNTIEEHIMTLLYEKINLFERIIGELDNILSNLNITDIEQEITRIYHESSSEDEAKIKLRNLSSIIEDVQNIDTGKEAPDAYE